VKSKWIGSEEHKRVLCETFVKTHKPFLPEEIEWPELDADSLNRLKSLPIWNEAVKTESSTAVEVQTLGRVEPDPILAEAIALQGYEEGRHAAILGLLTRRYGIAVEPFEEPAPPEDPVRTFLATGYGECLDSFFAFGLFAIGKRSQLFPAALIDIFDPIMQEEARHILFVVNWSAYLRARTSALRRPAYDLRKAWIVADQIVTHARNATRVGGNGSQEGFTMSGHNAFGELSARSFLELCLAENDRRLAPYDPRLLRPALVPSAVRFALRLIPSDRGRVSGEPAEGLLGGARRAEGSGEVFRR
jgi:hypothetical protein